MDDEDRRAFVLHRMGALHEREAAAPERPATLLGTLADAVARAVFFWVSMSISIFVCREILVRWMFPE